MSDKHKYLLVQYVTVARIPIAAAAAWLLQPAGPGTALVWVVVGLLVLSELTDMFDGMLARKLGMSSRFGALFDPYCDSVSRMIIFFGLAMKGLCPYWLFLLMALRDVSVAYIRIMNVLNGRKVGARHSGKAKAWAQGLGAIILGTLFAAWDMAPYGTRFLEGQHIDLRHWAPTVVVALVALVTLWSLLDYFDAARRREPEAKNLDKTPSA